MILRIVCWSNSCEVGMIGTMRVSSFQSRLVNRSFYFAQELISLSNLPYRLLVGRNYFLPSFKSLTNALNSNPLMRKVESSQFFSILVQTVNNTIVTIYLTG